MVSPKFFGPLLLTMFTFTATGRGDYREGIEYGRAGDFSLRLDAHFPDGSGPFPAAIIVHGGGWIRGDRKHSVEPLFKPLSDAGFAWFSISYRLAGDMHDEPNGHGALPSALMLGAAIDDVRQAVAYVKQHAAEYRIDPGRIALIGESAGAQLASMAALKPGPNGSVRAVVALYGPSDLVSLAETSPQIPDSLRRAVQGTPFAEMLLAGLRNLSPINFVKADSPPFLLIHGTADTLVPFEQSERMCRRIREAGDSCELYPVKGGGHGMRWWESQGLTAYKHEMIRWLRAVMLPRTASAGAAASGTIVASGS